VQGGEDEPGTRLTLNPGAYNSLPSIRWYALDKLMNNFETELGPRRYADGKMEIITAGINGYGRFNCLLNTKGL